MIALQNLSSKFIVIVYVNIRRRKMWVLTHIENGERKKTTKNPYKIAQRKKLRIAQWPSIVFFCVSLPSGQRLYILTNKTEYIVGRDSADLLVLNDLSISRNHAKIQCLATCIKVLDSNSKYGVFVNGGIETNTPIAKNRSLRLEVGDTVRFGRMRTTFRVEKIDIKVCTSTLDDTSAAELKSLLQLVGGKIESHWTVNCTHLVMPTIIVTVKALQSLAHGVPIVSPEYFVKYTQNAKSNEPQLPDVNDFTPETAEPYILREPRMMHVNLERQRLFQNKTFIFMVKRQMMNYKQIIELAGGKCMNLQEDRIKRTALLKTDNIPIQYSSSGNTQCSADVATTADYIVINQRRLIGESEIGLALLHRSIQNFCNPDHQMVSAFEMDTATPIELRANVLAHATPIDELDFESEKESIVCVPETIDPIGEESNNNDIIFDSEKPSTSSAVNFERPTTSRVTRRSAAISKRTHDEANSSSDSMTDGVEPSLPAKKQKVFEPKVSPKKTVSSRKQAVADLDDSLELPVAARKQVVESTVPARKEVPSRNQAVADLDEPMQAPAPANKQVAAHLNESNNSSMASQSTSRVERISGFVTTQNRFRNKNRNGSESQASLDSEPQCHEKPAVSRKRVLGMLDCDDDDSNNESTGDIFGLNRKQVAKRNKPNGGKEMKKISLDSDDDEDGGNLFAFGRAKKGNSQAETTKNGNTSGNQNTEMDRGNEMNSTSTQDSFKKPYQHVLNRSTFVPLAMPSAQKITTDWITVKTEKLNLNGSRNAAASTTLVRVKEEKLDEWEMTDEDKKRRFIDSVRNAFQKRTIDVNQSRSNRQLMADECDEPDGVINPGDSTLKHTNNFKYFVKVTTAC